MTGSKFNRGEAMGFLADLKSKLFDAGGYIELRSFSEKERDGVGHTYWLPIASDVESIARAVIWAEKESARGRGVFVGYNPRREMVGTKGSVESLRANYQDIDVYKTSYTVEQAYNQAINAPITPDLVINSGRGIQVVYLHDGASSYGEWLQVQEALYTHFKDYGSDRAVVTDQSRVLRLPGAPNHKGDEPLETGVLFDDALPMAKQFSVVRDEYARQVPKANSGGLKIKVSAGTTLSKPIQDGERNVKLHKIGSKLCDWGADEGLIRAMLAGANSYSEFMPHPLTDEEIKNIATQAAKYQATKSFDEVVVINDQSVAHLIEPGGEFIQERKRPLKWILHGLARGMFGMVQAMPNAGKTTIILNASISLSVGRDFDPLTLDSCGDSLNKGKPRRVLYIDCENSESFLQSGIRKMIGGTFSEYLDEDEKGNDLYHDVTYKGVLDDFERGLFEKNFFVCCDKELGGQPLDMTNESHRDIVKRKVEENSIDLVVVDTLAASFSLNNENDNSELQRRVLNPMVKFASDSDCAVLVIHHTGKKSEVGNDEGMYRSRGASAIPGTCRLILELSPMRDGSNQVIADHISLRCVKSKMGKPFDKRNFQLNRNFQWYEWMSQDEINVIAETPSARLATAFVSGTTSEAILSGESVGMKERTAKMALAESLTSDEKPNDAAFWRLVRRGVYEATDKHPAKRVAVITEQEVTDDDSDDSGERVN